MSFVDDMAELLKASEVLIAANERLIRALEAHAIETSRLTQELTDACHDIDRLMEQNVGLATESHRFRTCLEGISRCATCEVCRGAALLALEG